MSGGEKISHSAGIKAKLQQTVSDMHGLAHTLPTAPTTGIRPEHQQLLNSMFQQTRKRLHGVATACGVGIKAITESDAQDEKSGKSVKNTPQPRYGK